MLSKHLRSAESVARYTAILSSVYSQVQVQSTSTRPSAVRQMQVQVQVRVQVRVNRRVVLSNYKLSVPSRGAARPSSFLARSVALPNFSKKNHAHFRLKSHGKVKYTALFQGKSASTQLFRAKRKRKCKYTSTSTQALMILARHFRNARV